MDLSKVMVVSTVATEEIAINCAQVVLESNLAACVNIVPKIHSIYRWKGQIVDDRESMLIIKTVKGCYEDVRDVLEECSGYEVTEVLCLDIADGAEAYLKWVEDCVTGEGEQD